MSLSTAVRATAAALLVVAQDKAPVRDSVYTAAQARRGKSVYETRCSRCHGADLTGVRGSALAGEEFMRHWEGRSVERLFRKVRDTMPPGDEGTLTDGDTLDAIAYVLQQNGFPEGATELAADRAVLENIRIAGQAGATLARSGSLVQLIGCLAREASAGWRLIETTEPQPTTLDAQPRAESRADGAPTRGTGTARLLNAFPDPSPHEGHTMQATGFLIRDADGDRINVVKLEMVDSRCGRP